jgi:phosphate ABC transporter phosphate-binding protein
MKRRRRALAGGLAAVVAAALAYGVVAVPAPIAVLASSPTLYGAGSTWVQIALDQWVADVARQGLSISFQGVGSSTGRQFYIDNQVDFAASEIPFQPSELQQLQSSGRSFQYVPDVAGGTTLMYNLHTPSGARITDLHLNAAVAANIFTGQITSWQDPSIEALNPGLQIAETKLIPVIRSDGSGTSAQFSLYLANQAPAIWNAFVSSYGCAAPCSNWPNFPGSIGQNGSDGVADFVSNNQFGDGSIGYVEAGYAFQRGFPVAELLNASGNYAPDLSGTQSGWPYVFSNDVAVALKHATLNADLTQNLTGVYAAPEPNAYPMSSYSYLITQTTGFDPAKGYVLGTWIIYIACAGQQEATPLGYSPMPPNLVADAFSAVERIPGAPTPPPIDAQHCPNPTVVGNVGQPTGSATTPASGSSKASATAAVAGASRSGGSSRGASGGATAGADAAAVAGDSSVLGAGAGGSGLGATAVATMTAAQRQASFLLAEQEAHLAQILPGSPLAFGAAVLLIAVFLPVLFLERRRGLR